MTEEEKIYRTLVKNENPDDLNSLWKALGASNWFPGFEINLSLPPESVVSILKRYLNQTLTEKQVEDWANFIEALSYMHGGVDDGVVIDTIHDLANPVLEGKLTPQSAQKLIDKLVVVDKKI